MTEEPRRGFDVRIRSAAAAAVLAVMAASTAGSLGSAEAAALSAPQRAETPAGVTTQHVQVVAGAMNAMSAVSAMSRPRPTIRVSAPSYVHWHDTAALTARLANARPGARIRFETQTHTSAHWEAASTAAVDSRGRARIRYTFVDNELTWVRAVLERGGGRPPVASTPEMVRVATWEIEVASLDYDGTVMTARPDGSGPLEDGFEGWLPEVGDIDRYEVDDAIAAATDEEIQRRDVLGSTGSPERTRTIVTGEYFTPSSGLTPEYWTSQLFVYDPFRRAITRTITLPVDEDVVGHPEQDMWPGDGDIFVVEVGPRGTTGSLPQRGTHVVGYDMVTGERIWDIPGEISQGFTGVHTFRGPSGGRPTVGIEHEGSSCSTYDVVDIVTGSVLRTVGGPYTAASGRTACHDVISRHGMIRVGDGVPGSPFAVYDTWTGRPLNVPAGAVESHALTYDAVPYDRVNQNVAWEDDGGALVVSRASDGATVYTLPADRARPVSALIALLSGDDLWVKTTSEYLRIDIRTGAYVTAGRLPQRLLTVLPRHWALYSDGTLRRDQYEPV